MFMYPPEFPNATPERKFPESKRPWLLRSDGCLVIDGSPYIAVRQAVRGKEPGLFILLIKGVPFAHYKFLDDAKNEGEYRACELAQFDNAAIEACQVQEQTGQSGISLTWSESPGDSSLTNPTLMDYVSRWYQRLRSASEIASLEPSSIIPRKKDKKQKKKGKKKKRK